MVYLDITHLDLCGSIVGLKYQGHSRYKSAMGGVLSIFLIIGIFCILIAYLYDFFKRTKVKMSFEENKYYNPPVLNISEKFIFIVMTQYEGRNELRNDVIKIDAVSKTRNNSQWEFNELDIIPCKPSPSVSSELFDRLELSKGVCFNTSGLSLEGSHATEIFKYLQIRFRLCLNGTDCLPENEMVDFFDKSKPVSIIYFVDSAFQIYNTSHRVADFYNYLDLNLTFQNNKETNMYYSLNEMYVDDNYFFPGTPTHYSEFMIESSRDKGAVRSNKETAIMAYNFMSSNYKTVTQISYMQITELLTTICAIINVLIIAISSIGYFFNDYLFQSDLMNSFYESETNDESGSLETNRKVISLKIDNKFPQENKTTYFKTLNMNITNTNTNINTNMQLEKTHIQANKSTMPFALDHSGLVPVHPNKQTIFPSRNGNKYHYNHSKTIKMVFMSFCVCFLKRKNRENIKNFGQVNRSLLYYQDMKNVYRKLMEIDLLKYLLLTEEQLELYQILPRPEYYKHSDNKTMKDFSVLLTDPHFHFLKSKKYIEKVLKNPEYNPLFITRNKDSEYDKRLNAKIVKLIVK